MENYLYLGAIIGLIFFIILYIREKIINKDLIKRYNHLQIEINHYKEKITWFRKLHYIVQAKSVERGKVYKSFKYTASRKAQVQERIDGKRKTVKAEIVIPFLSRKTKSNYVSITELIGFASNNAYKDLEDYLAIVRSEDNKN